MPPQVLIVGAGPTGLVIALTLLKSGVPVRIIDKVHEYHVSSRGSGVQARIQEIEYFLGTLPDIQAIGMPPPNIFIYDLQGNPRQVKRTTPLVERIDPTAQFPISSALMVNQYLHEGVLRSHVKAHGGMIELGSELTALEQDDNSVTVHLTKATDGKQTQETASFSYVIGADGGHSSVRRVLGLQFLGESHEEERILTADVDLKGFERYGMHGYILPDYFLCFRSTNTPERFQVLITGHGYMQIAQECRNANLEEFQAILRRLTNRSDLEILKLHTKLEWRYNARMVDHFQNGRVFVAGDAAHAHSPMGGQGLTSSVQDAFNLAWKLALVVKGYASPKLLTTYEEERSPCIADMLLESSKLHRLAYDGNGDKHSDEDKSKASSIQKTIDALGSVAAPLSTTSDMEKKREDGEIEARFFRGRKLFQLDLNYRWSSIIFDERLARAESAPRSEKDAYGKAGHDVRAGDRAPDAPGLLVLHTAAPVGKVVDKQGEVIRIFDVFDPAAHIALIFSTHISFIGAVETALKKLPPGLVRSSVVLPQGSSLLDQDLDVDLIVSDNEGHAYQGYGVSKSDDAVIVVRPDGMIGAFATSESGIGQYFAKVFALA